MPQLHFYVPHELADKIQRRAAVEKKSVSRYVADLIRQEVGVGWPKGFFNEVIGSWKGKPLQRPSQGKYERRDSL